METQETLDRPLLLGNFDITFLARQNQQIEQEIQDMLTKLEQKSSIITTINDEHEPEKKIQKACESIRKRCNVVNFLTLELRKQWESTKTKQRVNSSSEGLTRVKSRKDLAVTQQLQVSHTLENLLDYKLTNSALELSQFVPGQTFSVTPQFEVTVEPQNKNADTEHTQVQDSGCHMEALDRGFPQSVAEYIKQLVYRSELVRQIQQVKDNKGALALARLLKENQVLRKCLHQHLDTQKDYTQYINQNVSALYTEVNTPIKQLPKKLEKNQPNECKIY